MVHKNKRSLKFFDSYDPDLEHKNNSSRFKRFMATMETWETSSPGLENMGMDVSHVLMGGMRSNQYIIQHNSMSSWACITNQSYHHRKQWRRGIIGLKLVCTII
jgi:hypothetical protein